MSPDAKINGSISPDGNLSESNAGVKALALDSVIATDDSGDLLDLKWFQDLAETYWVPSGHQDGQYQSLLDGLRAAMPPGSPTRFIDDLKRAEANIEAVRDFLTLPYSAIASAIAFNEALGGMSAAKSAIQRARFTATALQVPSVKLKLDSMMRQAVVLLWGAYETFCRDLFVSLLNEKPGLVTKIVKSPLKDRFPLGSVLTIASLEAVDFNLNGSLGDLLAEGKDFSAPWLLRSLFRTLLEGGSLDALFSKSLESRDLWLLGHRRHVVAHRCGIVDAQYLRETGDSLQVVAQPLKVTRNELRNAFTAVHFAIAVTVGAAGEKFGPLQDLPDPS